MTAMMLTNWSELTATIEAHLEKLSDAELADALVKSLILTAESYHRAAVIAKYMKEKRGMDISGICRPLAPYIIKIAYGQMLPEVMVFCGPNSLLLRRVSALPIPDQRALLETESLPLAEGDDHRMVDPRMAEKWQIQQLFAEDHIRELHEQRQWIKNQTNKPHRKKKFRAVVMRPCDVAEGDMTATMSVALTPEWEAAIRTTAKQNKWSMKYAATRFLISLGKK